MRDATRSIHAPEPPKGFRGVSVPVWRASTVVFPTADAFERRYDGGAGYTYGLYGTPTSRALEAQLNDLAGGAGTLLTPSGQSALVLVLTALLEAGDDVLVADGCYGPLRTFCDRRLAPHGFGVDYYDPLSVADLEARLTDRTRVVVIESPSSNTFEVGDVTALAAAARRRGALVVADNTWATSILFKPLNKGVDVSVEALSKFAGGHGDLLMGAVTSATPELHGRMKDTARLLGLGASSDDCALVLRGLQTLPLRLQRSFESGLKVAGALQDRPGVGSVLHPALPECPGHAVWRRDFAGGTGVFSFTLAARDRTAAHAFVDALRLFRIGASWGGAQSLVTPQDPTRGRTAAPWRHGPVVRLSVGLEDPADLLADLERGLAALADVASSRRNARGADAA